MSLSPTATRRNDSTAAWSGAVLAAGRQHAAERAARDADFVAPSMLDPRRHPCLTQTAMFAAMGFALGGAAGAMFGANAVRQFPKEVAYNQKIGFVGKLIGSYGGGFGVFLGCGGAFYCVAKRK